MGRYVIRRLLWTVLVVLVVTLLTFLIFFVMPPGDPAIAVRRQAADARDRRGGQASSSASTSRSYQQYRLFVKTTVPGGDEYGLARASASRTTAASRCARRSFEAGRRSTLQLALGAAIIWLIMGISIGIISALKRRTLLDRFAMGFALFGVSAPVFWLGLMALFIFWKKLGIGCPARAMCRSPRTRASGSST